MMTNKITYFAIFLILSFLVASQVLAESVFNPNFIISDAEMRNYNSWTRDNVQQFLDAKGSYLRLHQSTDVDGLLKPAADIIYNTALANQINPKFLLVTLQKEQSLITDDSPTQKQLDWATGYAVCGSCNLSDPDVQKHKGFATQVDSTASLMRWYYDNKDKSFIKKKDTPIRIDNVDVTPQSWATAFLYTYTPHLHGNKNFWRIWQTWFSQFYPDGSLLSPENNDEVWLIDKGLRRKFVDQTALITRFDPKMVIRVAESELSNYNLGQEITYPNYSILKTDSSIYLLDYDVLRPFASEEVVRKMGFNPQEMISATEAELLSYPRGETITIDNKSPQGVIFKLTDSNTSYLFKDNKLYPFLSKKVAEINYKNLSVEKHKMNELTNYEIIPEIVNFKDGTLLKVSGSNRIYVMENGKKRPLADNDTFLAMGYKKSNVITAQDLDMAGIPQGEEIFLNVNLVSAKNKFLGDSESLVSDLFNTKVPSYLVAEYPSGRIISGKDIDTMRPLASFTKLMTAFEALDQGIDFKKTTTYDSKKYEAEGNVLQLQNGEKIKNVDLFNAMLIRSINNVARMVAQSTALTEEDFVSAMNKTLANWGADNTTIADTTGIDPNNQSTPRDLLKIFTKVLTNKTIKDTLFKTTYTFKEVLNKNKISKHALQNTNQLLNRSGRNYRILASKTGYLEDSGFNIIMLIESKINKKQYIVITMGDPNYAKRFEEPHKIAQWIATGKVKITNKN